MLPMTMLAPINAGRPPVAKRPRKRMGRRVWRQRDAEDSRHFNLEMDVRELRQQIAALNEWRDMLQSRCLPQCTNAERCLKIVVDVHGAATNVNEHTPLEMARYMERVLDDDILVNSMRGRHQFAVQGRALTGCMGQAVVAFEDAKTLSGSHDLDDIIIRSTSEFQTVLTEHSLATMFPHIQQQQPALLYRLRGKTLVADQHIDFTFNFSTRKITSIDIVVDFFSAFMQLPLAPAELLSLFADACPIVRNFQQPQLTNVPHDHDHVDVNMQNASRQNESHPRKRRSDDDKMALGHILSTAASSS